MNRITLASPTAVPSYAEQLLESKQFGLCGLKLDNYALEILEEWMGGHLIYTKEVHHQFWKNMCFT